MTIKDLWADFRVKVIPADAPARQVIEMRRAFYAGCESLLRAVMSSLSPGHDVTADDEQMMERLDDELRRFATDVQAGVA